MTAQATTPVPTPSQVFSRKVALPVTPAPVAPDTSEGRRKRDSSFRISLTAVREMHAQLLTAVKADEALLERILLLRKGFAWVLEVVVKTPMQPDRLRAVYTAITKLQEVQDILLRERHINTRCEEKLDRTQQQHNASLNELRASLEWRRVEVADDPYFMASGVITGYYLQLLQTPVPSDANDRMLQHYDNALRKAEHQLEQFAQQAEQVTTRRNGVSPSTTRRRADQLAKKRARTPPPTNAFIPRKKNDNNT